MKPGDMLVDHGGLASLAMEDDFDVEWTFDGWLDPDSILLVIQTGVHRMTTSFGTRELTLVVTSGCQLKWVSQVTA